MLTTYLPVNSRRRRVALSAAAVVGILFVTQVLLPGSAAKAPRGTPLAILFTGVVFGCINSLTAAGLVLIYRTTRIINFAQTAIGAVGAVFCFEMVRYTRVPFPITLTLSLLVAGLTGLLVEIVFIRRFSKSPRLVLTVLTILLGSFLSGLSFLVKSLPFFPKLDTRSTEDLLGFADIAPHLPFPGYHFTIGSLKSPFGFSHLFAIEITFIALVALAAFFRFTRFGVAVRAMAENSERSALLGMSVGVLSSVVWVVAAMIAAVSVILTGFLASPANATGFAPGVLLTALAAAIVGRMRSLPVTVAATIGISVLTSAASAALPKDRALIDVGVLLVIVIGLLLQRKDLVRGGAGEESSWQATAEQRAIPKELSGISTVRFSRLSLIGLGLLVVVVYPFVTSTRNILLGGDIALYTIVALSLVVLTGWAGQVSLGQFAFAAVGAVVGGALTSKAHVMFWLAVPIASAVAGAVAVLVGLPALRIKGLFLAVTTLAFAFAIRSALFSERYFKWLLPRDVHRPKLFLLDFQDEKSMYFLCIGALVLAIVIVTNLRKSRLGRLLIAVRESDVNVQSFGISAVRLKLVAFAVAGAMAGFAGAIFAHQLRGVNGDSFGAGASINIFVLAVLGGIGSPGGALLGSAFFNIVNRFLASNVIVAALSQFGVPLLIIYTVPGGLISIVMKGRDSVLRIIAQRRQIVVPSLFADYDPDALEARLIPLAEPISGAGLAALPGDERYALASELYQGDGERTMDKLAPAKPTKEAAAIGAASGIGSDFATPVGTREAGS